MQTRKSRKQAGFSVVEALVAFVVVGFGMLALAGMQLSLSRSADNSKQRTEAMRLAQDKMEALRSFTSLTTGTVNWNGLAGGNDTISSYTIGGTVVGSNTSYTRTWSIGGANTDVQRPINVSVTWTDRAGSSQSLNLASVIARVDPQDAGFLAFPLPENTNLKRPKNRNLNIPITARDLGGGNSAYQFSQFAIVFSDVTGYVIKKCDTTNITSSTDLSTCANYNAYILAGYITGSVSNGSGGVANLPTGINVSGLTGWDSSGGKVIQCAYGQAKDQNLSTDANPVYISGTQYYLCVIPVTTNGTWSGVVRLGGVPTTSNYKVCRFQYASSDFVNDNERNYQGSTAGSPTGYTNVNESLDNQNYYIETSSGTSCPTIGTSITGVTGGTVATTLHQDCRLLALPTTDSSGTCPATAYNAASAATP